MKKRLIWFWEVWSMHKKEDVNMPGDAGSQDAALFLADVEAQI